VSVSFHVCRQCKCREEKCLLSELVTCRDPSSFVITLFCHAANMCVQ
jgi:hypothetical protein